MQTLVLAAPKEYWMMNKVQKLSNPEFMSPAQNLYYISFTFQHTQLLRPKSNRSDSFCTDYNLCYSLPFVGRLPEDAIFK
jgi:hypothetical protein